MGIIQPTRGKLCKLSQQTNSTVLDEVQDLGSNLKITVDTAKILKMHVD